MSRTARSLLGARLASWLRAGEGARAEGVGPRPAEPLVLFEFEACPFCRRVREALTRLDLEAVIRPCPKGGRRHREALLALGGKEQFPFLVDPNAGIALYESSDIVAHLERRYGRGQGGAGEAANESPPQPSPRPFVRSTLALVASGLGRGTAGSRARPSRAPAEPLVFHGFEADPGSRLVREVLCELELVYRSRPAAPGSLHRSTPGADAGADARARADALPRLVDPNCGFEGVGWRAIVDHLESTYALGPGRA